MTNKLKRFKDILIYIYIILRHFYEWIYVLTFHHKKLNTKQYNDSKSNSNYLIIMQKWVKGSNLSDFSLNISETFVESNIGNLTEFFIDEFCLNHNKKYIHSELMSLIHKKNISHLVVIVDSDIVNSYNYFSINYLTRVFNLKLIPIIPDSVWFFNQLLVRRFDNSASLIITLDSSYFTNSNLVKNLEKFIHLFAPLPASQFHVMNNKKDIDVLFIGRLQGRSSRKVYIDYLIKKGVNVVNIFSDSNNFIEKDEYNKYTSRAKIILNFSFTGSNDEFIQLKGRPFEASLMGALLIENESEVINRYFEPHLEYVPFDSKESLYNAVNSYLINNNDREKVIKNANEKALKKFSATTFWKKTKLIPTTL